MNSQFPAHKAFDPAKLEPAARHKLTIGTIVPRPIAWISSVNAAGAVNLAPFSYFMGCHSYLPAIAVSIGSRGGEPKDSRANIEAAGEFVVNVVTDELAERMNMTAADFPPDISELAVAGLTPVPSVYVKAPRVAESPIHLECKVLHTLHLGEAPRVSALFVAQVVMWHIREDLVDEGYRVDQAAIHPIARMGGPFYVHGRDPFRMDIPDWHALVEEK